MSPEEVADLVRRARERGEAIAEEQRQHQKLIAAQRNAQPQGSLTAHMLDDATIRRLAATTADSAVRKACNSALHSASAKVRRRMRGRIATILNARLT